MGHVDDRPDKGGIVRLLHDILDKGFVNFQGIKRIAFQIAERGVAGTKIVNRQANAGFVELAQDFRCLDGVVQDQAFGNFQFQLFRRQAAG